MNRIARCSIMLVIASFLAVTLYSARPAEGQEWAKARLEDSPRHLEYVKVRHGDREVNCFIAYPEVAEKAHAVIVIHEIFGLTDWVRSVTDQLAEAGYIAIAPDLLSGMGPDGGGTEAFGSGDNVRGAIRDLPPDQITADLDAVAEYVKKLPAAKGSVSVAGFCWGGSQAFRYAANNPNLAAAFVFYGSGPEEAAEIARIDCPVYGFYGENDARINATIPDTTRRMAEADKIYEPVIYDGAGHGFLRAGEDPNVGVVPSTNTANQRAREDAWARWKELLEKL